MSSRTANQIISSVLKRVGNETITTEAQAEFANIHERLTEDYRWPFLRVTETGVLAGGDNSVALPLDFVDLWTRTSLRLTDTNGSGSIYLTAMSQEEFDTVQNPDQTGAPQRVLIDLNTRTWRPYPLADKSYNYELVYRSKPARITNFDAVVTFPNDSLLSQLLFVWALQYEDDDRYGMELGVAQQMLRTYLKQFNFSPTKTATAALRPGRFNPIINLR